MLGGLLELQNLEVSDIMVHRTRMTMIDASEPVDEIVAQLLKSGRTRIPVWRDKPDNIIGVLHAKNLFAALQKSGGDTAKIEFDDILSPPWFVPDTRPITDQLNAFLRRKTAFRHRRRRIWRGAGPGDTRGHHRGDRRRHQGRA